MTPANDSNDTQEPQGNRFNGLKNQLGSFSRFRGVNVSEETLEQAVFDTVLLPRFLERLRLEDGVSRTSQWLAAFLLAFVIPISINIMVAFSLIMESILTAFGDASEAVFFQFLISGLNLAFIALGFWFWILWVSTGGFRLLEV